MGRIVVSDNASLDGVIQDPAGDEGFRAGGWVGLIKDSPQLGKLALDEALGQEAFLLGRRTYDFARLNVECGAVPGTGHFVPRYLSISERPAAVSAGVVEREELAVDVEQGNLLALHLDQTRLTRLNLSCPRCLHKVSHRSFPPIYAVSGKGVFGSC